MITAIDMIGTIQDSGSKTYNINFCNSLQKKKINKKIYIFICKSYLKEISFFKNNNIQFIIKPDFFGIGLFRILWMQFFFPFELYKIKANQLFSTMNFCPLVSKFLGIKIILATHSNLPWVFFSKLPGNILKKFFIRFLMKLSIIVSDLIIVPSNFAKNEIEDKLKLHHKKKVISIYLGIDDILLNSDNKNIQKNFNYKNFILSILSCSRYHNIINILKAFYLFKKENKTNHKFIIVTQILDKKYFKEIALFVKNNSIQNDIIFFHNLDKKFIKKLYQHCEFYIFSSYCESFGFTSIEAMSQKTPVALSNMSSIPEINGDAAIYFNPDKIEEIKECIYKLSFDKDLKKKLLVKGNYQYRKYKWSVTVDKTLKILNII